MMKDNHVLTYLLFVVAQTILSNYFHFTPFITISILPAMAFLIHPKINSVWAMAIAFGTGLAVDFFAEGTIGINAASLVPVALLRRPLIEALCGNEPFEQKESISIRKYGFARISLAIILMQVLFNTIYTVSDCAGTRPFWFIAARIGASALASYLVSMLIVNPLTYDDRR